MMRDIKIPSAKCLQGFTLIELVVATMIIGLLALVAAPNFIAFRDKARVAKGMSASNAIQAALAAYTTSSVGNLYPASISNFSDLVTIANDNGTTLDPSELISGLQLMTYSVADSDGNGEHDTYSLTLRVLGVATQQHGWCVIVEPPSVRKCPGL